MTFAQWQGFAQAVDERALRIRDMIVERGRDVAEKAGLPRDAVFHMAHNAMASFNGGNPWRELNYSFIRQVLYIEEQSYRPYRIAQRIITRAWKKVPR